MFRLEPGLVLAVAQPNPRNFAFRERLIRPLAFRELATHLLVFQKLVVGRLVFRMFVVGRLVLTHHIDVTSDEINKN